MQNLDGVGSVPNDRSRQWKPAWAQSDGSWTGPLTGGWKSSAAQASSIRGVPGCRQIAGSVVDAAQIRAVDALRGAPTRSCARSPGVPAARSRSLMRAPRRCSARKTCSSQCSKLPRPRVRGGSCQVRRCPGRSRLAVAPTKARPDAIQDLAGRRKALRSGGPAGAGVAGGEDECCRDSRRSHANHLRRSGTVRSGAKPRSGGPAAAGVGGKQAAVATCVAPRKPPRARSGTCAGRSKTAIRSSGCDGRWRGRGLQSRLASLPQTTPARSGACRSGASLIRVVRLRPGDWRGRLQSRLASLHAKPPDAMTRGGCEERRKPRSELVRLRRALAGRGCNRDSRQLRKPPRRDPDPGRSSAKPRSR